MAKAILAILSVIAINQAVLVLFNYNMIVTLIPQYTKWIFGIGGVVGGIALYGLFQR